nr:hypothetical protein MarQu_047 [Marseillevirus sp.]
MDKFIPDTKELVSFLVALPLYDEEELIEKHSVGVTATEYRLGTKIVTCHELPDRSKHGKAELFDSKKDKKEVECTFKKGKLHGKYTFVTSLYDTSEFEFVDGTIQRATFAGINDDADSYIRLETYKNGRLLEKDAGNKIKRYIQTKDGKTLRVKKVVLSDRVIITECFASNGLKKYLNLPFFEMKTRVYGKKGIVNQRTFIKE